MDLSTLPLMPSMDLPPPVDSPVPTAQRPMFDTSDNWQPAEQAADGCFCPSCQELRERDRTASSMRQQYGSIAVPLAPMVWSRDLSPVAVFDEVSDQPTVQRVADAFSGAVTGRISASQPAMANIPPAAPPAQSTQRIRGRYTLDTRANASMAGSERWLDPCTGTLYDNASDRASSNSGLSKQVDGTWISPSNMVWEAT